MVLVLPPFENDLPIPTLSLFVKMLKFITLDENDFNRTRIQVQLVLALFSSLILSYQESKIQ